jgi:hypothetical protein
MFVHESGAPQQNMRLEEVYAGTGVSVRMHGTVS